jgi:hypothetical protein
MAVLRALSVVGWLVLAIRGIADSSAVILRL